MVSACLRVCLAAVAMQGLLHLRPDYPVLEADVRRLAGLPHGLLTFELSIAEFYPLTLGVLAVGVSSHGPLTPWGVGLGGSLLAVAGEQVFVRGVARGSVPLLFTGRLVFSLGEVFAQDVALIPLFMQHFTAADTSILYAAVTAGSYFSRAGGLLLHRYLQDEYGLSLLGTLSVFWLLLTLYPVLYLLLRLVLPAEAPPPTPPEREDGASLLSTVLEAFRTQRDMPWCYWFMMAAAALFNASSLTYDDFVLLPEVFRDVNTPRKAGRVLADGYTLVGGACLLVTWLYYRGVVIDENPHRTGRLLFLLLCLRLAGFVYMGARLLLVGRQVARHWSEVGVEVAVHLGTFLFDMWAEPHLVSLAGHGNTSEACVMGLLTFVTALVALPLVHLQEQLLTWHSDASIVVQVAALCLVLLCMFLVWRTTPSDVDANKNQKSKTKKNKEKRKNKKNKEENKKNAAPHRSQSGSSPPLLCKPP